jgi:hypothetical protein
MLNDELQLGCSRRSASVTCWRVPTTDSAWMRHGSSVDLGFEETIIQ